MSIHYETAGVGVGGPYFLYVLSIVARISLSGLPSSNILITSRVMPIQMSQARLMRSKTGFSGVDESLK